MWKAVDLSLFIVPGQFGGMQCNRCLGNKLVSICLEVRMAKEQSASLGNKNNGVVPAVFRIVVEKRILLS